MDNNNGGGVGTGEGGEGAGVVGGETENCTWTTILKNVLKKGYKDFLVEIKNIITKIKKMNKNSDAQTLP